ncbi:uncharacterized protein LOC119185373 isoform X1 [Rhipicephalus microplus]|uniref:uncharacterized protein LOC119185373 isoform X1 n=3 Tax=Rhipicephalus microplus TaxID=6941 RepID=UPI003F6CC978
MATNPFLFYMQILLFAGVTKASASQATTNITDETTAACCDSVWFSLNYTEDGIKSRAARSTSPDPALNVPRRTASFSGCVSWPTVNMATNPFLFYMQILLFAGVTKASASQATTNITDETTAACCDSVWFSLNYTEDGIKSRAARSTSPDPALNVPRRTASFSGCVSWPTVNMATNPFLFYMQILLFAGVTKASASQATTNITDETTAACCDSVWFSLNYTEDGIKSRAARSTSPDPALNILLFAGVTKASASQATTNITDETTAACCDSVWFSLNYTEDGIKSRAARSTSPDPALNVPRRTASFSGCVSWPTVNMATNPFLFYMQVCNTASSCKSSNRCFIQLTCPECFSAIAMFVQDFACALLILCGDIESNPGPTTEELLTEILAGQKVIQKRLDEIEQKFKVVDSTASLIKEVSSVTHLLDKKVKDMEKKLVDLEDRGRRNNLLVFGVPEKQNETQADLEQSVVKGIFEEVLGTKITSIERIHRIGRSHSRKPRPVILKLFDYREKINVLKNGYKLKGQRTSIAEDFSACTRQKRRNLWESTTDIRKSGKKVKLIHDKIKIENNLFEWDDSQKMRVLVQRKNTRNEQ